MVFNFFNIIKFIPDFPMFDRHRLLATLANEAFEVIQSQAIQKLVLSGGDGHATMEGSYTIRISNRDEYQCKYMYK